MQFLLNFFVRMIKIMIRTIFKRRAMEVKDSRSALLSNFEVYQLLQEARTQCKKQPKKEQKKNLATVVYETSKYLDSTPCKSQTVDCVQRFLMRLKDWPLTKV